jgi:hypothetical protein
VAVLVAHRATNMNWGRRVTPAKEKIRLRFPAESDFYVYTGVDGRRFLGDAFYMYKECGIYKCKAASMDIDKHLLVEPLYAAYH